MDFFLNFGKMESGRCHEKSIILQGSYAYDVHYQMVPWPLLGFLRLDPCFRRCKLCKKSHDIQNPKPCWNLKLCKHDEKGELNTRLSRPSEVKGLTFEMCQSGKLTPEVEKAFLQGQIIWCKRTDRHGNHEKSHQEKCVLFWGGSGKT